MIKFNPEMLILAREARGLSQEDLASELNIQQGTLSKIENGNMDVGEHLENIYKTLSFPKAFFFREGRQYETNAHYYRKKIDVPKKEFAQARATINILKFNIEKLLLSVEVPPTTLPVWDVEKNGPPSLYAKYIREFWRIPKGRIDNLTKFVEDNGIIVLLIDLGSAKLDGLSIFTNDHQAIIFLNKRLSGDRLRLTLAHELGHLGMHFAQVVDISLRDVEKEAFEFASELLVPANDVIQHFSRLNLEKLADLKRYWKVSMSSLVYKAKDLKAINENQARYLWQQFRSLNYHVQEPFELEVPVEKPTLVKEITDTFTNLLNYSIQELSELLCLNREDFEVFYTEQKVRLKIL